MPAKNQRATTSYNVMVTITNSDAVSIATGVTDAIVVTGAGNLVIIDASGNATTHTGIPVGTVLPVHIVRINATLSTGTAAALYY